MSNPLTPSFVSQSYSQGYGTGIDVSGDYAYVAALSSGLQVINVSDPANPVLMGSCVPGDAHSVFILGNYAYVADWSSLMILRFTPTGIEKNDKLPSDFSLSQNYPNPFNARTTIQYSLPKQSMVSIDIFDILGRKIRTLEEGMKPAGKRQAAWDASGQASGIYFYRIKAGDKVETKKMALLK